ncbi:MAG: hypothetical protein IT580_11365 [Verrucomicrobiales bacterium]|nr:hypothetical protein [Verrucomicrobiales bacterium]
MGLDLHQAQKEAQGAAAVEALLVLHSGPPGLFLALDLFPHAAIGFFYLTLLFLQLPLASLELIEGISLHGG